MDHRRPLFAFMAVFVVAMLVVGNAARSDAFRQFLREHTVMVVAGSLLDAHEPAATSAEPQLATPEAEPADGRASTSSGHGSARKPSGTRHHAPARGRDHGTRDGHGPRHQGATHRPGHAGHHGAGHGTAAKQRPGQAGHHRGDHAKHGSKHGKKHARRGH